VAENISVSLLYSSKRDTIIIGYRDKKKKEGAVGKIAPAPRGNFFCCVA